MSGVREHDLLGLNSTVLRYDCEYLPEALQAKVRIQVADGCTIAGAELYLFGKI